MSPPRPNCVHLYESGKLLERVEALEEALSNCNLCPRRCGVDRLNGEMGACGVDARAKVAAMSIHPWEEPPISGMQGSGTVFFSGCTLKCLFCQNYPISQLGVGRLLSVEELAQGMLRLQRKGACNINLVTPTHQVAAFGRALLSAVPRGLNIPVVYNTSGYERAETIRLLEGLVDVYLPDIKYADGSAARLCSGREDYVEHNRRALLEMWRQAGPLKMDDEGVAYEGLLVRHMVLPDNLAGTRDCLEFLAHRLGSSVWVSLMNQYFPAYKALGRPPFDRRTSPEEYAEALQILDELGLSFGFVQECAQGDALDRL